MTTLTAFIPLFLVATVGLLLEFIYMIKCCCSNPSDRTHDLEGGLAAQPSGNPSNKDRKSATPDRRRAGQKPSPSAVQPASEPPQKDARSAIPDTSPAAQKTGEVAGQPFDGGRDFQIISFAYPQLKEATRGFSKKLGEGGFGRVYEGVIGGRQVAVKKLKKLEIGSSEAAHGFEVEIETISRINHRNLVHLIGYCNDRKKKLLVYEFLPNKSLSFHLHDNDNSNMKWPIRMKIAKGSAKGLKYLHVDCNPRIIHRDIKADNVLLGKDFEPKLADFGLAKWFPDSFTHLSTDIKGTFGYLDPNYAYSSKLTEKSDMYSFGVMLLELITGRKAVFLDDSDDPISLASWAEPQLEKAMSDNNYDNFVDPKVLEEKDKYNKEMTRQYKKEMTRMILSALACIRSDPKNRPCISQVVQVLEGCISHDKLFKGFLKQKQTFRRELQSH